MKKSIHNLFLAPLMALVLTSVSMLPVAEAREKDARVPPGGNRQVNNNNRDVRSNNVRNTSVNNVNINKNVNVNVNNRDNGWDNDRHPVAVAAAVVVTAAVIGSVVRSVPPNCVPMNYNGMVYQQCGSSWYQPQYVGTQVQYVVVVAPR